MEGIRFISQNAERNPTETTFMMKIRAGDIAGNLGPSTDFSLAENMPAGSGLIFFLDRRKALGFSAIFSVSAFKLFLGRAWDALLLFTILSLILPPHEGQYF
jgi:hypothetical protein